MSVRTELPATRGPQPASRRPIDVLVVDDHRTFAELMSRTLALESDIRCVGTPETPEAALAAAATSPPDVVVVDIEMPHLDGLELTRRLRALCPATVVVVVTAHQDPSWLVKATQAGASAFVPKNGSLDELLEAIRHARQGGMMVAASAFAADRPHPEPHRPEVRLTAREQDVLTSLGRGLAPREIAQVLGISVNTCRGYVKNLLAKLEVNSQLEAVLRAQRLGLLPEE